MKNSYLWIFWSALTLSVITAVTLLLIITDLSLFRDNPLVYILSAGAATAALSVLMHNHNNLPLLRSLRLQGRLLTAPLMLLVLSVPAALIYINYDLNGRETLRLLSSLFTSLAAVFFFASLYTFTMMSRATIFRLFDDDSNPGRRRSSIMVISPAAVVAVFIII
jgi:hypothetical protein